MSWNNVLSSDDPQLAYDNFSHTFTSLYDIHIPLISKKFNRNIHKIEPWFTAGLLVSRRNKINLTKNHFLSPSQASLDQLKIYRNLYNKLIRLAKKMFYEYELRINQGNLKKSWDLIRHALNKKQSKNSVISKIISQNRKIDDPLEMANCFNDFFTSIPSKIINEINSSDCPPDNSFSDNVPIFEFASNPLSCEEIINITNSLQPKKTLDLHGFSVWLVQKTISIISHPLRHIFSNSFTMGVIPSQLKIAKVVPVFKSGGRESMDNYRPISLLSCFSKILEKIVSNRLTSFLDSNNLITNCQYGFRKKHSTTHPLIHFLNHVSTSLDKKLHTIAIFCDLRKAFDTVNHSILLSKLKKLGVRGVELQWFKNYLSDRKQLVHVNGSNSSLLDILIGVPQGSILGPLLFLIYINDFPNCSYLLALLFADDTTLYMSGPVLDELILNVNREFKKIVDYFRFLKLALHPEKTKFILFTNSSDARNSDISISLNFNNDRDVQDKNLIKNLERITSNSEIPAIKFLGIYIDPLLSFKHHISTISSKLSKSLYFLRSVKNILTPSALKSVYYSILHSHFIYGIQIWSSPTASNFSCLFTKQKSAIRLINFAKYNSHTEPLFKLSGILPLPKLVDFFKLQFFHNFIIGELPASFANMWERNEDRRPNQAVLRNHLDYTIPTTRLTSTEKFPFYSFPRTWSSFPDANIKAIESKSLFNIKLKEFFLSSLSENYICNRLLRPHCHLRI